MLGFPVRLFVLLLFVVFVSFAWFLLSWKEKVYDGCISQNVITTLYRRWNYVKTLKRRRRIKVVLTSCACEEWENIQRSSDIISQRASFLPTLPFLITFQLEALVLSVFSMVNILGRVQLKPYQDIAQGDAQNPFSHFSDFYTIFFWFPSSKFKKRGSLDTSLWNVKLLQNGFLYSSSKMCLDWLNPRTTFLIY